MELDLLLSPQSWFLFSYFLFDAACLYREDHVQPQQQITKFRKRYLVVRTFRAVGKCIRDTVFRNDKTTSSSLLLSQVQQNQLEFVNLDRLGLLMVQNFESQLHPWHGEQAFLSDHGHQKFWSIDIRRPDLLVHLHLMSLTLFNESHSLLDCGFVFICFYFLWPFAACLGLSLHQLLRGWLTRVYLKHIWLNLHLVYVWLSDQTLFAIIFYIRLDLYIRKMRRLCFLEIKLL